VQHATRDIGCDNAAKAMSTEAAAAAAAKDAKALEIKTRSTYICVLVFNFGGIYHTST